MCFPWFFERPDKASEDVPDYGRLQTIAAIAVLVTDSALVEN